MRLRYALPILALSALVMLTGLGLARAQQEPEAEPTPEAEPGAPGEAPAAPGRPGGRRGGLGRRGGRGAQGAEAAAGAEGAATPAAPGAPGAPAGPRQPAREFETGVDYQPTSPRTRVTFNLEDADLPDLVRLISNMTGKRFILPGKVRSIKATVFAPTEVTAAEAYNAFLSILEVNGMTVVPAGRYLKITETSGIEGQPISTFGPDSATPGTDRYVTHLHRVENISAEDAANLLSRFKSRDGNITAYVPTNMLIMTDTGTQIRRMVEILGAVDVSRSGEQVWIEPIHYANAADLASKLSEIFGTGPSPTAGRSSAPVPTAAPRAPGAGGRGNRAARNEAAAAAGAGAAAAPTGPSTVGTGASRITSILSDERTNSLIILATEAAYLRILEMIRQLDIPLEGEGRIHVHYVQHGNADELADALNSLIGGPTSSAGQAGGGAGAGGGPATASRGAAGGGPVTDLFEGAIRITSYEPTNALVITSTLHDYAALRTVIERLDSPRRQVFIEAVIMELAVTRSSDLGISFHGGIANAPVDGALSILGFNAGASTGLDPSATADLLTGMAIGVRGPAVENSQQLIGVSVPAFGVVITALAQSGDINVLSTPHVMAMDNVEAEITVGENIPLQTNGIPAGSLASLGGLATGAAQTAALSGLAGSQVTGAGGIPRQDVGTTLRFTPHINDANEIRLEIEEEISEAGPPEGQLGVVPIRQRMAKTELTVRDQQTIVIGGLMREALRTNESKVPILGDIPLIGALFRQTQRQMVKTNLLLFLTPYIIRDPSDLRAIFERKMRERQEFLDRYFVFGERDYEPPVDYSRTRGLVTEIINELAARAIERELLEAARSSPPPEHVPRAPVGSYERSGTGVDVVVVPEGEEAVEEGAVDETGAPAEAEAPAEAAE